MRDTAADNLDHDDFYNDNLDEHFDNDEHYDQHDNEHDDNEHDDNEHDDNYSAVELCAVLPHRVSPAAAS